MIDYRITSTFGWVRLFGFGIHWRNKEKHPLLFSERYGHSKYVRFGKWIVRCLNGL